MTARRTFLNKAKAITIAGALFVRQRRVMGAARILALGLAKEQFLGGEIMPNYCVFID